MASTSTPFVRIPVMQVRPTGIVAYEQTEWIIPRPKKKLEDQAQAFKERRVYSGEMTAGSRKRMRRAIQTLIAISKPKKAIAPASGKAFTFRINFITLTLPAAQDNIPDSTIRKDCLEPFLRRMRTKYRMKNYIWKAERQLNGNLHYHITADTFVLFSDIQQEWNNQLAKLGFIDRFEEKHQHRHPNSTDVHSVNTIKNLAGYLIKYMAKDHKPQLLAPEEPAKSLFPHRDTPRKELLKTCAFLAGNLRPIEGKMWDCSLALKQKDKIECVVESEEWEMLDRIELERPKSVKKLDTCVCYFMTERQLQEDLTPTLRKRYNAWIHSLRNFKPPPANLPVPSGTG